MKKGFTIIELLVASLLLGMLVTILTMIFNQSSIAWRTGRASVSDLAKITQKESVYQYVADNAIPFLGSGKSYCTVSPWRDADNTDAAKSKLYPRGIALVSTLKSDRRLPSGGWSFAFDGNSVNGLVDLDSGNANNGKTYVVGVKSAGPDRHFAEEGLQYAEDDITTWPDGIE